MQAVLTVAEHLAEMKFLRSGTVIQLSVGHLILDCLASVPHEKLEVVDQTGALLRLVPDAILPGISPVLEILGCSRRPAFHRVNWLIEHFCQRGLELGQQAELFRDIVRGPFRPLYYPAALRQQASRTVRYLADTASSGLALDALPVLADALEEVGCNESELLDHLRGPATHVRGCWALDLVLGRW